MEDRERQIIELKIRHNEKLIVKLEESNGDPELIKKYKLNIIHYKSELDEI